MFISGLKWTSWNELKGILVMDQLRFLFIFVSIVNIYSTESLVFGTKSDDRSKKKKKKKKKSMHKGNNIPKQSHVIIFFKHLALLLMN